LCDLVGDPDTGNDQQDRDHEPEQVHQHAMTVVVVRPGSLIFAKVTHRRAAMTAHSPGRDMPLPERHDAALIIGRRSRVVSHGFAVRILRCSRQPPKPYSMRGGKSTFYMH